MICLKYVQINLSLTSSLARPLQVLSLFEVKSIHQSNFQSTSLVRRKKGTIPGFTRIRKCKGLKKIAENSGFIPAEACGLQDDVILLSLASSTIDTMTTKFTGRACAVQCNSLRPTSTDVDQVVVVVLKFPIKKAAACDLIGPKKGRNFQFNLFL